jgi:perosamine synthetase
MASDDVFRVPMSAPDINEQDVEAVAAVVRSGRLALGPKCVEFERLIAGYVGVRHAVAVSSGTAALHLLVRILGIGEGDEVLVPSFTFAASVNAILYERATPVFVDIEPETYNLDPVDLERRITSKTKAIMAVDVFGHPAPWDEIERIASRHGLLVIDDCCEALGAEYKGRRLGQFGSGGAFAFYPNKQITTGEGGVVVTNDDRIAQLAVSLRNQGRDGGTWLSHARLGFNYRLDDMSAAIGCSQMARIDDILAKRARVAQSYTNRLSGVAGVRPPVVRPDVKMSWFVYVITLDAGVNGEAVIEAMEKRGVPARAYFTPIHTQQYMQGLVAQPAYDLPVTDATAGRTIALPFYNNLSDEEIDVVARALEESICARPTRKPVP